MELEIYWTEFSEKELSNIFKYYAVKASVKIAKNLTDGIYNETLKLKAHPEMGQIEELLHEYKQEFRYLVFKDYKILIKRFCASCSLNVTSSGVEMSLSTFRLRSRRQKLKFLGF